MGPTRSNRIENSKRPKSACPRVTSAPSDWSAGSAVLRSISLFAGSIDESPSLGPEKLHARERGGSVVFSSLHEVSVSVTKLFPLPRVRRRVGTGDGRMDPRARLRITGAVHRRGRVRGWRGLARVAVPTRGACEPFVPSGADQTVPLTTLSLQGKPWWWGLCGSVVLVVYGFIPCMQPMSDFGRVYAVYGGFFIALSYLWGEHPRRRNPKSKTHPHHPTDSPPPNSSPQGTDWTDSSPTWVTWSGVRCA